jgi:Lrp/AsnC family leucine-responsive transcriptional regulator
MDSIDIKILKLLQSNARMSASQISSKVNLSIPAVSDRLKKLDASGIVEKYTIIINNKKLNRGLTAFMFVSMETPKHGEDLVALAQAEDAIIECYYLVGDYDYLLKIITKDTETLESILHKVKSVNGIMKTKTMVSLTTVKNNLSISPIQDNI